MHTYLVTRKSSNKKTGPIMVTTSQSKTCPAACPFRADNQGGCYAQGGPLGAIWRSFDYSKAGESFSPNGKMTLQARSGRELCAMIEELPEGALWRHNQAGDLPGDGDAIDVTELGAIVAANTGRRGFTYTHKPITGTSKNAKRNRDAVRTANVLGFTINLSANTLAHADELAELEAGPVVVVTAVDSPRKTVTPAGRTVVTCPATYRDDVSCATCQLCQRQRDVIVGFPAHGAAKRKAEKVTQS